MLLLFSISSRYSFAQTITEVDVQQRIQQFAPVSNLVTTFSSPQDFIFAQASIDPADRVYVTYLWLDALSRLDDLNLAQKTWLEQQTLNATRVNGTLLDHPQRTVELINIQAKAKSTLRLLNIKQLELKFQQLWDSDEILWQTWLEKGDHYAAFINWLRRQSIEPIQRITRIIVNDTIAPSLIDNRILYILHQANPSFELAERLLQRPTDEFTYQFVQSLPSSVARYEAIHTLNLAVSKAELVSQAILILAQHYAMEEQAQTLIENAFDSPQNRWYALAALTKINDNHFKRKLQKRFESQQTPFAKTAIAQLLKEDQQ